MKKCQNCLYETEKDIAFCPKCGTPVVDATQEESANMQDAPDSKETPGIDQSKPAIHSFSQFLAKLRQALVRRKITTDDQTSEASKTSNKWFKISLILVSSVAILAIFAWAGYKIYLNNNPKIVYLLAENSTMKAKRESVSSLYEQDTDFWRALGQETSSFAANVQTKFDIDPGMDMELLQQIDSLDLLENITLSIQGGRDVKENWSEMKVELLQGRGRKSFVDVTLQKDQNHLYLSSDTLLDSPIYWKDEDLFRSAYGDEDERDFKDEESEQWNTWLDSLELSEKEKDTLQQWLMDYVLSELTNHVFEVDDNASYATPDGTMKMKKLSFTLDEMTLKRMLINLIDDIRTNEALREIIISRAELIVPMIDPPSSHALMVSPFYFFTMMRYVDFSDSDDSRSHAFADEDGNFNRQAFNEALQTFLVDLRNYILLQFKGELYVEAYLNKNNIIVERYIELTIKEDHANEPNVSKIEWTHSYWKDKQSIVHMDDELTFTDQSYGDLNTLTLYRNQTLEKTRHEGIVEGEIGMTVQEDRSRVFDLSIDYAINEALGTKGTSQYDILVSIMAEGEKVTFDIQAEREKNIKKNSFEQNFDIETDITLPAIMGHTISLSANTNVDLTMEKGTPPAKSNVGRRAERWSDMSEEERDQFWMEWSDRLYRQFSNTFLDIPF